MQSSCADERCRALVLRPPMFWAPFIVVGEGGVYKVNNGGSESGVRIRCSAERRRRFSSTEGYLRPIPDLRPGHQFRGRSRPKRPSKKGAASPSHGRQLSAKRRHWGSPTPHEFCHPFLLVFYPKGAPRSRRSWGGGHAPQKPSSQWTRGPLCTNFQPGPLGGG